MIQNIPLLGTFNNEEWALPVQKSFKYSYKQKKILFDCFMQGETTGRKMTPKDVCCIYNQSKVETIWVCWRTSNPRFNFMMVSRNIRRKLYRSQLLQIQMMTMSLRKTMKTVMIVIMEKNKELNWFNKLKISCFICNWFSVYCFEYQLNFECKFLIQF